MCADFSGELKDQEGSGSFRCPFDRNVDFVGRQAIINQLLARIPPGIFKDDCQRTAIVGLSGIGKTQIALEAAYQVHEKHPDSSVFWVTASTVASFRTTYLEIGKQLGIKGIDEKTEFPTIDGISWVKKTLELKSTGEWLLIVDNANDEDSLFGDVDPISNYLPFSQRGSILFITRNHDVLAGPNIPGPDRIIVDKMDRSESVELLGKGLGHDQMQDVESIKGLLNVLGDLPLAVKQASAFIAKTGMSTASYLASCQSGDRTMANLLSMGFDDWDHYDHGQHPIATTWLVSFEYTLHSARLAAHYLKHICLFAEDDIPPWLLSLPIVDESRLDEVIGTLKAYAFITERKPNSLGIHRLVRLAMRNWLQIKGQRAAITAPVIRHLARIFPESMTMPHDVLLVKRRDYLPHAQSVLDSLQGPTGLRDEVLLLYRVGHGHLFTGRHSKAEQILRQGLDLANNAQCSGLKLDFMARLSASLLYQDKWVEAEEFLWEILKHQEALHRRPEIAIFAMNSLVDCLQGLGRDEEAMNICQQLMVPREILLGKESAETIFRSSSLASLLARQGNFNGAEHILRDVIVRKEKVFGKEHPSTILSMDALTQTLNAQKKYKEAEAVGWQLLELRKNMLGEDHFETITSSCYISSSLYKQGRYNEAENMQNHILVQKEKILGKEHCSTLATMNALAATYFHLGKYNEAEEMYWQVLELGIKVQGEDHPETLRTLSNLSLSHCWQGKFPEGVEMQRNAVELTTELLGKTHTITFLAQHLLEGCLEMQKAWESWPRNRISTSLEQL